MLLWIIISTFLLHAEVTNPGGPTPSPGNDLTGYDIYPIPENENCTPLQPGQSTIVDNGFNEVGHTLRKFRLTRLPGQNQFQVDLNINFVPSDDLQQPQVEARPNLPSDVAREPGATVRGALDDEARARMLGRVNQCLRQHSGQLRSPDGTQIRFNVESNPQSEVPQYDVQISTTERSSVADWSNEASCGTIIHEMLHLTGLCDGYRENFTTGEMWGFGNMSRGFGSLFTTGVHQRRFTEAYPCRPIEPLTSIMNQSGRALIDTSDALICQYTRTAAAQQPSQVIQVTALPESCPRGSTRLDASWITRQRLRTMHLRPEHATGHVVYHRPIQRTGFALSNAHTRFITQPHCISANQRYLTCTQDSYEQNHSNCHRLPPYCADGSYLQ